MTVSQASLRLHDQSIRYVKGVGPRRMEQLAGLGIQTLEDACFYPPRRYEDRAHVAAIRDIKPGEAVTVHGKVIARELKRIRGRQPIFEITVSDGMGLLRAIWFHSPYLAQQIQLQDDVVLYGKVEPGGRQQMIHPEFERVDGEDEGPSAIHMGRIVPVYPVAAGISQRWMRQLMFTILEESLDGVDDPLPAAIREARGWPELSQAIRDLHFPSSMEAAQQATERLAFDELLLLQAALAQRRARTQAQRKPHRYDVDGPLARRLREQLPFKLTPSQQQVLDELCADLAKPYPMYRLLQGDVGCGKTIVVVLLAAIAAQSGCQVALMVPTELLAEQHARVVSSYLEPLGISVGLLSQGVAPPDRRRLEQDIEAGRCHVVIGTHALIQRRVTFKRLSLVVIDEQHKFGVIQRAGLAKKAEQPDVLVLTATPIPRTLALSLYGDLSVSTITELPPGRNPIDTLWIREAQRHELYAMIRRQLGQGRQGYIVYPMVDEGSTAELKAATQMARELQETVFPEFRVGLLHGQLSPREKDKRMRAFAKGDTQLLVSTVIVEVGLDVPNATLMIIEHPERFGLAQLHQMRGRIGRGKHPATCVLISDAQDEAIRQRLTAFVQTTDGFQLAEKDLQQRGPGHLLGRHQHGWFRFRVADLARDRALLESARQEADALIAHDPELAADELRPLRERLHRFRKQAG